MLPRLKTFLFWLMCLLMLNCFVYAAEDDPQQLPEQLEEITLDNVKRIVPLATFSTTQIDDVVWSSDGRYLAAAARDGIWVYDFKDKVIQSKFVKTASQVYRVIFIPNSPQFIAGDSIYDADTMTIVKLRPNNLESVSHDGTLYASRNEASITITDFQTNKVLQTVPISTQLCEYGCSQIAFSLDDKYLVFSANDGVSESGLIEVVTGKRILFSLEDAWSINYSPDGSMIGFSVARPGYDGRQGIQIIDSMTGKKISFLGVSGSNNSPIFSRDEQLLVIGGITDTAPNPDAAYGVLYFFDMKLVKTNIKLTAQDAIRSDDSAGWVNGVAFSPNYHLLATGTADNFDQNGQLIIWGVPAE